MLTEQLLEHWNLDAQAVVSRVHQLLGTCDVFIGGSLADDLGSRGSDLDLYCFLEKSAEQVRRPVPVACGDAILELHVVDVSAAVPEADSLAPLLTDATPPPAHTWPLLSPQRFRQLHALYRDRALCRVGPAETLRRVTAADLLHLYVALRATFTAASLIEDVGNLTGPGESWAALYCARLAAESALDAALATYGYVNPNPKWRMTLAHRAQLADPSFPSPEAIKVALFPDPGNLDEAVQACLTATGTLLRVVQGDEILASFPVVKEAIDLVGRAASMGSP